PAWTSYLTNAVVLPLDDVYFSHLSMTTQVDDFTGLTRTRTGTCSSPPALARIVTALQRGTELTQDCGGFAWRVFRCDGQPVLCFNCKLICVKT
ncbi:hypothetical protein B484DRAFT_399388, partial [Ochromonadaceae sp. CCMP2298]